MTLRYCSLSETGFTPVLTLVPMDAAAEKIAIEMMDAISAYSMAVVPFSSFRNLLNMRAIQLLRSSIPRY